jgi:hypothetical protein
MCERSMTKGGSRGLFWEILGLSVMREDWERLC